MKSIAILGLLALVALVSAHQYHIQATLGDGRFEPVNGTLKLIIRHSAWLSTTYRLNETKLETGRTYTTRHEIPLTIDKINNVTFYWTLSSPIPPKYYFSKPSIYFKQVKIIPSYIQNPSFRESESRSFCSGPILIKHKQEVELRRC